MIETHMTASEYLHYRKQMHPDKPKEKGNGFAEILEKKIKKEPSQPTKAR